VGGFVGAERVSIAYTSAVALRVNNWSLGKLKKRN
jgi:hypothetical protein